MKTLTVNSYSLFPTYIPYSSAYLCGLLKKNGIDATQLDVGVELWNYFLSKDYLCNLTYQKQVFDVVPSCPFCPPISKRRFVDIKGYILDSIDTAKGVLQNSDSFCNFNKLNWAIGVLHQAKMLIYCCYGTFLSNHMVFWPEIGFKVESIAKIYELAENRKQNPFIDAINDRILPIIDRIAPDIIMVDIVWPWDIVGALTFNLMVKTEYPNIHLNFPGQGFDEFSFIRLKDRFSKDKRLFFGFDSVFVFRNDEGVCQLANDTALDVLTGISNLAYMIDDHVVVNEPITQGQYQEGIFPDYSDLSIKKYFTPSPVMVDMLSSKCYWAKCNFCSINRHKGARQEFDTKFIVEKMKLYEREFGCRHIWFLDEACTPKEALKLSAIIIQEQMDIIWSIRTRIDKSYTFTTLKKMYEAGCRELWVGLEHVNPRILREMNKTDYPDEYRDIASEIIQNAAKIGIGIHFCLLLGFPSEQQKERQELVDFVEQHKKYFNKMPFFATFNKFGLMPGSKMHLYPEKFGIIEVADHYDLFGMECIPYKTKWDDQTCSDRNDKDIDVCIMDLLQGFVSDEAFYLAWSNITDSAHEMLLKEHCAITGKNPFYEKPSWIMKGLLKMYLLGCQIPYLSGKWQRLFQKWIIRV